MPTTTVLVNRPGASAPFAWGARAGSCSAPLALAAGQPVLLQVAQAKTAGKEGTFQVGVTVPSTQPTCAPRTS